MKTKVRYKDIWLIAYPIILGSIAQNIISFTDTAILGRVGEIALGAAAIGGLFYYAIFMLGFGFGTGTQIIVARRFGEKKYSEIGPILRNALWFILALSVILFVSIKAYSPTLLSTLLKSQGVTEASEAYLNLRIYGIFFAFINIIFRAFYIGIGKTSVISITTAVMAVVNIFFDYVLVFGEFGFPEMGIEGAALASVLAEITAMLYFFTHTYFFGKPERYKLFKLEKFNPAIFLKTINISFPVMLQNFVSISCWFLFFLITERLGEQELAISNIIRSLYIILLIPVWGYAASANTLVSRLLGENRKDEILSLVSKIFLMCMASVGVVVILVMIFPMQVLATITNDPILIERSLGVLYTISCAAFFIGAAMIYLNAISGTGLTKTALVLETLTLGIYVVYAGVVGLHLNKSISVVWTAEYVYGFLLWASCYLFLRKGKWGERKI